MNNYNFRHIYYNLTVKLWIYAATNVHLTLIFTIKLRHISLSVQNESGVTVSHYLMFFDSRAQTPITQPFKRSQSSHCRIKPVGCLI